MITQEDQDLIDKYLKGDLDESSRKAFESRIKDDKELFTAYQEIHDLKIALKEIGREKLREKISVFTKKYSNEGSNKVVPLLKWSYAIAATIVILLIATTVLYFVKTKPASIEIVSNNDSTQNNSYFDLSKYLNSVSQDSTIVQKHTKIKFNNSGLGFGNNLDSIMVFILNDKKYQNSYYFGDTLALFIKQHDKISISIKQDETDPLLYKLVIGKDTINIRRSKMIKPLNLNN